MQWCLWLPLALPVPVVASGFACSHPPFPHAAALLAASLACAAEIPAAGFHQMAQVGNRQG